MPQYLTEKDKNSYALYYTPDKKLPVYVVNIGTHKTPPLHSCGPATRPYYLLHLIVGGLGTVEKNGKTTLLKKGDAFIIRPGEIVTYTADKDEPWEYYWISFDGAFAKKYLLESTKDDYPKHAKHGYLAIKTALDDEISDEIGCMNTLFAVLDSIKNTNKKTSDDFVKTAISYIENNYFRSFNATSLANMLSVSRAHFSTIFLKKTGKSPYAYLLDVRIQNAKEYLLSTDLTVTQVAYSVGFSSIERFSECFKIKTGLSPKEFRKINEK